VCNLIWLFELVCVSSIIFLVGGSRVDIITVWGCRTSQIIGRLYGLIWAKTCVRNGINQVWCMNILGQIDINKSVLGWLLTCGCGYQNG
jgi:hypothetical protein